jgi:flagellar biosynthesis chaperone FliJ
MRAAVRRRAVELLRERRFQDWLDEQRRKEQAAGDELAVMRASRPEEWT